MKKTIKLLLGIIAFACLQSPVLYAKPANQPARFEYARFNNPIHRSVIYLDWQSYQTYVVNARYPVLILFTNAKSMNSNNELGWYMELAFLYNSKAAFCVVETNQHPRLAAYLHYQTAPSLYLINAANGQFQAVNQFLPKEELDTVVVQFIDANN